jgi:Spy/CpxP family protein refolding chaperone
MLPPPDDGQMVDLLMPPPAHDELLLPGDEGMQATCRGEGTTDKLNLTSDQEKQFGKLQTEMQKEQIEIRSKIQSLRLDLRDMFRDENLDQGKIESKLDEIDKLQTKIRKNHLDFWFGVNKILKPEQQKIWKQHRMILGDGMGPRDGRGMREGGGRQRGGCGQGGGRQHGTPECPNSMKN